MDDALIEQLLNEDESARLDFKRDQYAFSGETDEVKSELLKDILAFANAWRRDTAYILIGVREVQGGRSSPLGVSLHLNDHQLQQFVNAKTNRPVAFQYLAYSFGGVQLGIIEIPAQDRPLYLAKRFGRLDGHQVFVRRGSSTDIADPEEVARMGEARAALSQEAPPTLSLEWGEPASRRSLGTKTQINVEVLNPPIAAAMIRTGRAIYLGMGATDPEYATKLITYTHEVGLIQPLFLIVHNSGKVAARGVTVSGKIPKLDGLRLHDWPLARPSVTMSVLDGVRLRSPLARAVPDVDEHGDHWTLAVQFGTVRPGETTWSDEPIYLGANRSTTLDLPLQLLAENLSVPLTITLSVEILAASRPMTLQDAERKEDN